MANPLAALRRHQRVILAACAVVAIIVFTVGGIILDYQQGRAKEGKTTDEVVATWRLGSIRTSDVESFRLGRVLSVRFLVEIIQQTIRAGGRPNPNLVRINRGGEIVSPGIPMSQDPKSLVQTMIFAEKARREGFVVSDETIKDFLDLVSNDTLGGEDLVNIHRDTVGKYISSDQLFEHLRVELLAIQTQSLCLPLTITRTPAAIWEYHNRLHRRVKAEVLALPVQDFVAQVKAEPSPEQIRTMYEKYKENFPFPSSPEPGFRRRKQSAFQFVRADFEKLRQEEVARITASITEKDIDDYYEQNKREFVIPEPPVSINPSPETTPEKTPEGGSNTPPTPDSSKSDPDKAGAPKSDPQETDTQNPTPEKQKSAQPNSSNPDSAKPDSTKPDSTKPDSTKPDSAKPDSAKPDSAKPDSANPDSAKPDSAKPDSGNQGSRASESGTTFVSLNLQEEDKAKSSGNTSTSSEQKTEQKSDPEPAKPESTKSTPAPSEPTKTEQANAEQTKPDSPDTKADSAAKPESDVPSEPEAPPKPEPKYRPLDEALRAEIRGNIARQRAAAPAQKRLATAFDSVKREVQEYGRKHARWKALATIQKNEPKPVEPNFESLASSNGIEFGILPLVDALTVAEHDLGKATRLSFHETGFRQIAFAEIAFAQGVPLYSPEQISTQFEREYLFWKTDEKPDVVPTLDEAKADVVLAWKRTEALGIVQKEAEKLVAEAKGKSESLKALFDGKDGRNVVETGEFSWLSSGAFGFGNDVPTISQVDNVEHPGADFMQAVFGLNVGDVGFAFNNPKSTAYVFKVLSEGPDLESRRKNFLDSHLNSQTSFVSNSEASQFFADWYKDLEKEFGVEWNESANILTNPE